MNAHKYMEEFDEIDNRGHGADETPTRKKSTRRIFKMISIIILSVLCVTGGVLIHKLNNRQAQGYESASLNKLLIRKQPADKTAVRPSLSDPAPKVKQPLNSTDKTEISEVAEELTKPLSNMNLLPQAGIHENVQSIGVPIIPVKSPAEYTLAQALKFKEHFLTGLSCQSDYQALAMVKNKTPVMREVLNGLAPYCRHEVSALDNVKTAFVANKRKALVMMYQEKSPRWISYLKSVVVYLIEIRKLNPTSSRPKDILYKAQNEVYHNNIVKATVLLKQLPPQMQNAMPDFFREAEIYLQADNSLNELILSFEKGM